MGLLGGVARTAVIAGTATAVSNRVSRRQARRWSARDQGAEDYAGQNMAPADEVPQDNMSDRLDQLKQLGDLKAQGLLTEAEFQQQKARLLGA